MTPALSSNFASKTAPGPTPVPSPAPTPVPVQTSSTVITTLVRGIRIEAEDIRSFELVAPPGERLPAWSPGAHVQVFLPGQISRAYSLCNHAGETDCYRIAVKLDAQSRGGSRAMHQLVPGDRLPISAPRNLFELDSSAQRHVLIAGGIGITPLYSMFNALLTTSNCTMHYFSRSAAHAAFVDRMQFHSSFHFGLDAEETSRRLREIVTLAGEQPNTAFYTCGPTAFMSAVERARAEAGIAATRLRSERFGAELAPVEVRPMHDSFRVIFARSKIEVEVPAGVRIIDVARANGVNIPTSCEQGVCGACLSDVLEGVAEHHDAYLSDDERASGKFMLPCVSRCAGAWLTLDR